MTSAFEIAVAYFGLMVYPVASLGFMLLAYSGMTMRSGQRIKRGLSYAMAAFYLGSTFLPFADLFPVVDKSLVQLTVRLVTVGVIGAQWTILLRERRSVPGAGR